MTLVEKRGRWLALAVAVSLAVVVLSSVAGPARDAPESSRSADDFVDSMCVGTHFPYDNTPYMTSYDATKSELVKLGIRHIRDGGTSPDSINKMQDLAKNGIKTTFVIDPNTGTKPNASYWGNDPNYLIDDFVKKVGTGAIDAVEMNNEMDTFYKNIRWYPGDTASLSDVPNDSRYWGKYLQAATPDTHATLRNDPATAGVPLFGPSLTSAGAYDAVGDLSASIDASTVHWYLAGRNPETQGWGPSNYPGGPGYGSRGYMTELAHKQFPSYPVPVVATEGGYSNALKYNATHNPNPQNNTSEAVTARYLPRLFLYAFNGGFKRFCSYEFVDEKPDPENDEPENNFGLLRNDLSEKPAYTALKNLIDLLKDPGPSFTPDSLYYSLSGNTDGIEHTLLQKRDGKFYLVLWIGKPSYDPTTPSQADPDRGQTIDVPNQQVTVTLNQPIDKATTYLPNDSASPTGQYDSPTQLDLDVPDHPLVVEITPDPTP